MQSTEVHSSFGHFISASQPSIQFQDACTAHPLGRHLSPSFVLGTIWLPDCQISLLTRCSMMLLRLVE